MQKNIYEKWDDGDMSIIPPNKILKLVYKRQYFDILEMRVGRREITTISFDGRIEERIYAGGSRKVREKRTAACSPEAFMQLCDELEYCIENADGVNMYVDDSSAELKIYHCFGRTQTVERGTGNAEESIGGIMCEFLGKVFQD